MSAGLTAETSQYATLGMGGMNVLMTVVSLAIIEKAGRKTLMLIGLVGMMFDVILLTVCLALKVNFVSIYLLEYVIYAGHKPNVLLDLLLIGCGGMVGILQHRLDYCLRRVLRYRSWLHSLVPRYGTV